jgi:hypothetical protein
MFSIGFHTTPKTPTQNPTPDKAHDTTSHSSPLQSDLRDETFTAHERGRESDGPPQTPVAPAERCVASDIARCHHQVQPKDGDCGLSPPGPRVVRRTERISCCCRVAALLLLLLVGGSGGYTHSLCGSYLGVDSVIHMVCSEWCTEKDRHRPCGPPTNSSNGRQRRAAAGESSSGVLRLLGSGCQHAAHTWCVLSGLTDEEVHPSTRSRDSHPRAPRIHIPTGCARAEDARDEQMRKCEQRARKGTTWKGKSKSRCSGAGVGKRV